MNPIIVIETSDPDLFEKKCKNVINKNYKILSTSIGFINSEKLDFQSCYQAILIYDIKKENTININKDNKIKELKAALYEIHNKINFTRKQDATCFMEDIAIEQDDLLREIHTIITKVIK